MSHLVWLVIVLMASYSAFTIGLRWERGRQEIELDRREERAFQRSRRDGTVHLSSVKIRR